MTEGQSQLQGDKKSIAPIQDGWKCFLDITRRKKKRCKFLVTRKIKMIGTAAQEIIK